MRRTPVMCCLPLLLSSLGFGLAAVADTLFVVHPTGTQREGDTVTLSCHLDGPSAASFTLPSSYVWVKDGKVIPGQTGVTYNVGPLTKQDEGDYQCGDPDSNLPRGKYQMKVYDTFYVLSATGTLREGHTVTLACHVNGPSAASFTRPSSYVWVKDGKVILGQTGITYNVGPLIKQDEGDYQCGDPGSDLPRGKYQMKVYDTFFVVSATGTLREGHTVTLACHVDGPSAASFTRPSSYVWVKDGKIILGQTGITYYVGLLTKQDEGDYQCGDPDSDLPRGIYRLNVFIPGKDMVPKPTIFQSGLPVAGRPFFLDCIVLEGYAANDNTKYTWYKDYTVVKGETGQLQRFANLTEADEGEYVCTAREGPAETTSVQSAGYYLKPLVAPQVHIKPASNDSVVRGVLRENLTLTCEVTRAFPPVPMNSYSWSYLPSNQEQGQPLEEKSSTLTLSPLTRNHSGQYQCQARNDHDFLGMKLTGRASVAVDVVYLENIHMPIDHEISEGKNLILTCSVDSHPKANLTWTVDGKDVRHVTDNVDHYFIPNTHCSDSSNYTCRASNAYLPGLEIEASTLVRVHCSRDPRDPPAQPGTIYLNMSAPVDFLLPEQTTVVVVHPSGQDIITFHQNCSSEVSPAFVYRCLHPHCDRLNHHAFFTLTQLTERDEGDYVCLENGEREKLIPNCTRRLVIKRHVLDGMHPEAKVWLAIAVVSTLLFLIVFAVLIFILRHKMAKTFSHLLYYLKLQRSLLTNSPTSSAGTLTYEGSHNLEKLYKKGQVYVFPKLVSPQKEPEVRKEKSSSESTTLLIQNEEALLEEAAYAVKDLVRVTLQTLAHEKNDLNPPSFVLHNTRLSREENVILILSRKVGVVLMLVKAVDDGKDLEALNKSTEHLLEARKIVKENVEGLVHASSITAVIALPNLPNSDLTYLREQVKKLDSNRDVQVVFGREQEDFKQWAKGLISRPDKEVWDCSYPKIDSPDTAFEETASKFLTLAGSCHPLESPKSPTIAETWLLTPEQMEVRDSTARLLHIWGSPGSGKTMLLTHKARQWLADGKAVVIVVGREIYDVMLPHVADTISREQEKETTKKLRVCRTYTVMQGAMKELRDQYPDVEICIVIHTFPDTEIFNGMLLAVESDQTSAIWSVCSENLHSFDKDLSEKAHKLGWETANLPLCVRCTKNTVELLNMLVKGSPCHDEIAPGSTAPEDEMRKWEVLDHCQHPGHASTKYTCNQCREKMNRMLSLQGQDLRWCDWIALYTGDPNDTSDIKHLCTTLQTLGLPACLDMYDDAFAGQASHVNASDITSRIAAEANWWRRMVDSVDETGNPAVHLLRVKNSSGGLEKGNILLVHWDVRDDDPAHQSQDERKQRLEEHRRQWIQGVSRSKGQVILLLLTPSPARSLLNLPEAALLVPEASKDLATLARKP